MSSSEFIQVLIDSLTKILFRVKENIYFNPTLMGFTTQNKTEQKPVHYNVLKYVADFPYV